MNPSAERAGSKIRLIQTLLAHPDGLSLEELASYQGSSLSEIKKELGELYMIETYPYTPLDCVEVVYDGNKVQVNLPVSLEKSLSLNPREWMVLRDLILEDKPTTPEEESLRQSIRKKLEKTLSFQNLEPQAEIRSFVRDCIVENSSMEFSYWKRNSTQLETRRIHPYQILEREETYLLGFDYDRQAWRYFRCNCIFNPKKREREISLAELDIQETELLPNLGESQSEIEVELLATDHAAFHLQRKISLQETSKTVIRGDKIYYHLQGKVSHESWFLDLLIDYGRSVLLLRPKYLVEQLQDCIRQTPCNFPQPKST